MAIYSSRYNKSSGAHFAIFNSFENYRLGVTKPSYYFPNLKIPQALWFIYYANTFQIRKIVCMLFFAASKPRSLYPKCVHNWRPDILDPDIGTFCLFQYRSHKTRNFGKN